MGLIFSPSGEREWSKSYALLPTPLAVDASTLRIYYATLDKSMDGRVGALDVDPNKPSEILRNYPEPLLEPGEPGTFDDSGVNPSCFLRVNDKLYMYYIGWQRSEKVPYSLFCGLAISSDGLKFEKFARSPILERNSEEPFVRSATTVIADGGIYRMWYVSALEWTSVGEKPYPKYVIRHAESKDAIEWRSTKGLCIDFIDSSEFGFGRPWVEKNGNTYKMWYSIRSRSQPYRIGYAESKDGLNWKRLDAELSLPRSENGWDSEMICYPALFQTNSHRAMLYNGNQHGKTGFGYALVEEGK